MARAGLGYSGGPFSSRLEAWLSERADSREVRVLSDSYLSVPWGYWNLRALFTPDAAVHPRRDLSLGVWLDAGGEWEPSLSLRQMAFAGGHIAIWTPGIGRYLPRWYLRATVPLAAEEGGPVQGALVVSARRYVGSHWLQWQVSGGREAVELPVRLQVVRTWSVGASASIARARAVVSPRAGLQGDSLLGTRLEVGIGLQLGLE